MVRLNQEHSKRTAPQHRGNAPAARQILSRGSRFFRRRRCISCGWRTMAFCCSAFNHYDDELLIYLAFPDGSEWRVPLRLSENSQRQIYENIADYIEPVLGVDRPELFDGPSVQNAIIRCRGTGQNFVLHAARFGIWYTKSSTRWIACRVGNATEQSNARELRVALFPMVRSLAATA